jgi:hypothetical protein
VFNKPNHQSKPTLVTVSVDDIFNQQEDVNQEDQEEDDLMFENATG